MKIFLMEEGLTDYELPHIVVLVLMMKIRLKAIIQWSGIILI